MAAVCDRPNAMVFEVAASNLDESPPTAVAFAFIDFARSPLDDRCAATR
jgi:hypothetical protein